MEYIISLYLKDIDARFGQDSESEMFKQVLDWEVFETAVEPELKNYAYTRWYKAVIGAKRQLQLLHDLTNLLFLYMISQVAHTLCCCFKHYI